MARPWQAWFCDQALIPDDINCIFSSFVSLFIKSQFVYSVRLCTDAHSKTDLKVLSVFV